MLQVTMPITNSHSQMNFGHRKSNIKQVTATVIDSPVLSSWDENVDPRFFKVVQFSPQAVRKLGIKPRRKFEVTVRTANLIDTGDKVVVRLKPHGRGYTATLKDQDLDMQPAGSYKPFRF